jgi:hypothetical protein
LAAAFPSRPCFVRSVFGAGQAADRLTLGIPFNLFEAVNGQNVAA